ncbi:hypothetical protein V6N12_019235 [Hibiscus sabdariffa]|uniref:Uncharacterized protein n=1 Tax=Hibiscus sabdariffa TaxID=183260 RepID=A0ABR2C7B6_9ROSI
MSCPVICSRARWLRKCLGPFADFGGQGKARPVVDPWWLGPISACIKPRVGWGLRTSIYSILPCWASNSGVSSRHQDPCSIAPCVPNTFPMGICSMPRPLRVPLMHGKDSTRPCRAFGMVFSRPWALIARSASFVIDGEASPLSH